VEWDPAILAARREVLGVRADVETCRSSKKERMAQMLDRAGIRTRHAPRARDLRAAEQFGYPLIVADRSAGSADTTA
jgi:hypothetical protein